MYNETRYGCHCQRFLTWPYDFLTARPFIFCWSCSIWKAVVTSKASFFVLNVAKAWQRNVTKRTLLTNNPYKPGVLLMGHRRTEKPQMGRLFAYMIFTEKWYKNEKLFPKPLKWKWTRPNEPRREKTGFLHMRKQRRRSLCFPNPKFQVSSHFLLLYSPVCVGPSRKPRRPVFWHRGSNDRDGKIHSSQVAGLNITFCFNSTGQPVQLGLERNSVIYVKIF